MGRLELYFGKKINNNLCFIKNFELLWGIEDFVQNSTKFRFQYTVIKKHFIPIWGVQDVVLTEKVPRSVILWIYTTCSRSWIIIISRNGHVNGSPRLFDSTPLSYYLWSCVTDHFYGNSTQSILELRNEMIVVISEINFEICPNFIENFEHL